jgi:hypothetical protein
MAYAQAGTPCRSLRLRWWADTRCKCYIAYGINPSTFKLFATDTQKGIGLYFRILVLVLFAKHCKLIRNYCCCARHLQKKWNFPEKYESWNASIYRTYHLNKNPPPLKKITHVTVGRPLCKKLFLPSPWKSSQGHCLLGLCLWQLREMCAVANTVNWSSECVLILEHYFTSISQSTLREVFSNAYHPEKELLSLSTIHWLLTKFRESGSVCYRNIDGIGQFW